MDTELILAVVGVALAVVALAALSVVQQARIKRQKRQTRAAAEHSGGAPLKPFFIAQYRGNKARFFRVDPDQDAFLFVHAGPFVIGIDAETVRGTDRRHRVVRAVKLSVGGLAVGAVVAAVLVFVIGRGVGPDNNPGAAGPTPYGLIGLGTLLAVGCAVALPVVVCRIAQRAAELDALAPDGLRA